VETYGFIYMTTNLVNRRRYIGKKKYDRRGTWRTYLGSGVTLTRAIEKYGSENFKRDILDIAYSSDELNAKEQYWIEHYNAVDDKSFYNISPGGDSGNVRAGYTKEDFEKSEAKRIAAVNAGRLRGEETSYSILTESDVLQIIQLLNNDVYLNKIAEQFGVGYSTILDIRKHRTWTHLTNGIDFGDYSHHHTSRGGKAIDVFDANGQYISTYESARMAEKALGISYKLISQVCHGKKRTAHGYIFRFTDNTFQNRPELAS
jgi:group I intron endonuclease